jgi:hypothetical protein
MTLLSHLETGDDLKHEHVIEITKDEEILKKELE